MFLQWIAVAAAGLLLAADAPDDAVKKELEKFQGTWVVQSRMQEGDEAKRDNEKMIFDGSKFAVSPDPGNSGGAYAVDPTKKPTAIDITVTIETIGVDGSRSKESESLKGIYQFDGDNLTLAVSRPGKDRPTEFASRRGSAVMLIVLKREKK